MPDISFWSSRPRLICVLIAVGCLSSKRVATGFFTKFPAPILWLKLYPTPRAILFREPVWGYSIPINSEPVSMVRSLSAECSISSVLTFTRAELFRFSRTWLKKSSTPFRSTTLYFFFGLDFEWPLLLFRPRLNAWDVTRRLESPFPASTPRTWSTSFPSFLWTLPSFSSLARAEFLAALFFLASGLECHFLYSF